MAAAALVALAQPISSPWWRYADADSIYVGSALNIIHGDRTRYFDHPGLPLQEALAVVFGTVGLLSDGSPARYAAHGMRNLDTTRVAYRLFAVLSFLALVAFAFRVGRRELGGSEWGLAAALLVLAAPGLAPLSIQVRPDVLLCLAVLAIGWQLSRAWQTRAAAPLALAAFLIGAATTLKVHAAGMIVPLVVTAVLRHPSDGWWAGLVTQVRAGVRRRRPALAAVVVAWLAVAIVLNALAWPFGPAPPQRRLIVEVLLIFAAYAAASWVAAKLRSPAAKRVFDPFYGLLAALVVTGVAVPVSLFMGDGLTSVDSILNSLKGHGVNQGVAPFSRVGPTVESFTVIAAAPILVAALAAAVVAFRRRDAAPVPWLVGAAVLTLMAAARSGNPYYFAPGYVLAIPPALWVFRGAWRGAVRVVAWAAIVALALTPFVDRPQAETEGGRCHAAVAAAVASLGPKQVVLLPAGLPSRDARYWGITHTYVAWTPPYRYRTFPNDPGAARSLGLEPRTRITADCRAVPVA